MAQMLTNLLLQVACWIRVDIFLMIRRSLLTSAIRERKNKCFFYHLDLIIKDLQGEILWFYGFQSSYNNRRRFQEQTQDLMETEREREIKVFRSISTGSLSEPRVSRCSWVNANAYQSRSSKYLKFSSLGIDLMQEDVL